MKQTMDQFQSVKDSILNSLLDLHTHNLAVLPIGCILFSVVFIIASTFLITTCRFYIGVSLGDRRFRGLEPLTLPYCIPWIGSGLSIIRNPHAFYESAMFVGHQNYP